MLKAQFEALVTWRRRLIIIFVQRSWSANLESFRLFLRFLNYLQGLRVAQVFIHGLFHLLYFLIQVDVILLKLPQLLKRQLE